LLEQHPFSLKILANVLWSAGEAHMQAAISHERNQGIIAGSVWSAWIMAVVAGLILYGMVDDSPLLAAMGHGSIIAVGWKVIQGGCVLAASAIIIAGLPLVSSFALYAARERRAPVYLGLAIPLISAFALVAWIASVLIVTRGHWAASPWATPFSRPDWPSEFVRWITGTITALLFVAGCFATAACISRLLRCSQLPDLRIDLLGVKLRVNALSFAAALAPWVAAGIFAMLAGVIAWGCSAILLSASLFRNLSGPLGLSGLASWILSTIIFGFAAVISVRAAWRSRMLTAEG
jgi:hypothetical protein